MERAAHGNGAGMTGRVASWWRRTGADVPFGDPRPSHRAEMEGWFWRFTDPAGGRVVLVLCGVNRHPQGDWATVAVAAHPGGVVAHAAVDGAYAATDRYEVRAGDVLVADASGVRAALGGLTVEARLTSIAPWPRRALHGSGLVSVLPFLGQYWHPHVLGGEVQGMADLGPHGRWALDGWRPYAERNWGAGFPERWWWGQAQAFDDRDVCVAFAGGRLTLPGNRVGLDLGGVVVRRGDDVIRLAPPAAIVRTGVRHGHWTVEARSPRWRVSVDGHGDGHEPHVLPVPRPSERRNVLSDYEHQAGRLRVRVEHRGRRWFEGESPLAALEVGTPDPARTYDDLVHGGRLTGGPRG